VQQLGGGAHALEEMIEAQVLGTSAVAGKLVREAEMPDALP